ncbi:SecD/SecF fusion protein [Anseongella ginsenosidimutans]|uniref:Multifunctional fusion protein n=1 Tax=Anseongella ginsenosidimutans TaxID=496056 RepID=A0A4R3KSC8_9SPHI|nr:protein translocase subunit SecDF [Anseongella ginsenosidimutans]QEC53115.1 protein translocase subunit SecDF [Anseongella ginsenosidimutans]TCS87733.1 SecD/SecF fusion protein [Anseongella ginsenosidimutans]
MQGKGAIRFLAIIFAIACVYALSFTYVSWRVAQKAEIHANGNEELEKRYLDSMSTEVVYDLGIDQYTYQEVKERQLNLGLDLKGGMNVTLEVSLTELVRALANYSEDPTFNQALEQAQKQAVNSQQSFVSLFVDAYESLAPNGKLSAIFATPENQARINLNSSNQQVEQFLNEEANGAFERAFNIIRTRVDKFGVSQPNVQKAGNNRIAVELPGVDDPERVRKLLQGSAKLEFWKTYDNSEVINSLMAANTSLAGILELDKENTGDAPGTADTSSAASPATGAESDTAGNEEALSLLEKIGSDSTASDTGNAAALASEFADQNPLFAVLSPAIMTGQAGQQVPAPGPTIGYASQRDTAKVMEYLSMPAIRANFPSDLVFAWSVNPIDENNTYQLYVLKAAGRDAGPALAGDVISDARSDFGQNGQPEVVMSMNSVGAREWRRITAEAAGVAGNENDNKSVAIVLDGVVYSAPRVASEIGGGVSQISGSFTVEQTQDLANVLKAGRMPAPAKIVEEAIVGPTLGQESIQSGLISSLVGFVVVLVFMVFYYARAGWVANIALLVNLFFLMGVLAAWGAVLTLPGIAGIVLTIGMAVDANVLIYERIKEELDLGKSLKKAIPDGFRHAYSAIIDSNVTTLLVGIILWIFGSGPILGFATTLVIGILTSMFTAIFISRLIFETLLSKERKVTFSTKLTERWFRDSKFDFIAGRKKFYIISAAIILAGVVSMFVKGFSLGVDFKGGRTYVVDFNENVSTNDVRNALEVQFGAEPEVKTYGDFSQVKITTTYLIDSASATAESAARQKLEEGLQAVGPDYVIQSIQKVGPTIASDIKRSAVYAVLLALIGVFLYVLARFKRWQFGMGALVALAHDVLVLLAIFTIFDGWLPFSLDIDQQFIAAALTVMGYSINDTIVIFDRVREYMGLHHSKNESLPTVINNALNSTLSRTVVTGLCTMLVLVILFIFGGEVLRGFSFAMLIGIIFGTYSSLFVATPVVVEFIKKKPAEEKAEAEAVKTV